MPHKPFHRQKILQYVIIVAICVSSITALFAYQNLNSRIQTPIQDIPNLVQTKQTETVPILKSNYTSQPNTVQTALNITLIEYDIHEIANQARQSTGVNPISYDPRLAGIARAHSQDMAMHQFLSYNSYNGNSLNHRYAFAGYNCQVQVGPYVYSTSNENVAVVTAQGNELQIAQHIVKTWLGNVADSGNIFDTEHKTEGIGVALTENKMAVYVTEDIC